MKHLSSAVITFIVLFTCACSNTSSSPEHAGIAFTLQWPDQTPAHQAGSVHRAAPSGVSNVRISVSASNMTTMSQTFAAAAGTGSITNVPAGANRTITFEGLNASSVTTYSGVVSGVTLTAGQTYNCGTVTMTAVSTGASYTAGLIAYYQFNGNANDASGNSNNGTVSGASLTTDRFGNANAAYSFNGTDQFISTPLSRQNFDSITISVWEKFQGTITDTYRPIIGGDNLYFFIGKQTGNSSIGVEDGNYIGNFASSTNAWDGNWHHIVYSYNAGMGSLYLDGVLVAQGTFSKGSGTILIGYETQSGGLYFKGLIDDVRVYNRALASTEIAQMYTSSTSFTSGLMAYYPFNGNANDESGNGHDGVITGASLTADRFGSAGNAYSFSGNEYIQLINTSALNFSAGGFSLAAWTKFTADNLDYGIVGKHNCGITGGYFLGVGSYGGANKNAFQFYLGNSRIVTPLTYNDGNWHHAVGVYDGVNQYIYVDGAEKVRQLNSYSAVSNIDIAIGRNGNSSSCSIGFKGVIDDVQIYDRALSAAEIAQMYNSGVSTLPSVPLNITAVAGDGLNIITWDTATYARSYNIYWSQTDGVNKQNGVKIASVSSPYVHSGLTNSATYFYIVTAVNGTYESAETTQVSATPSSTAISNLSAGLVAYYPFTGNADDTTGNGHNGIVSAATLTNDRLGNANSAYNFNTSSAVISVASSSGISFSAASPLTVATWAFRTSVASGQHLLGKRTSCFSSSEINYQIGLDLIYHNGVCFAGSAGVCSTGGGNDLPLNTWTHVAATSDGSVLRLYLNGVQIATANGALGPENSANFTIGTSGSCSSFGQSFGGSLDDVRIYNRALSPSEIQMLYLIPTL